MDPLSIENIESSWGLLWYWYYRNSVETTIKLLSKQICEPDKIYDTVNSKNSNEKYFAINIYSPYISINKRTS